MLYTKAVIVLVGATTAESRWVRREIIKGWNDKRPLIGVRIHNLLDRNGYSSSWGDNPFASIPMTGGGTMADHVEVINPEGGDSRAVYRSIQDNLESWVRYRAYNPS